MKKRIVSCLLSGALLITCLLSLTACGLRGEAAVTPTADAIGLDHRVGVTMDFYGDVDFDGDVNMKDVLMIRKDIAGSGAKVDKEAADVNADGSVDMKDVLLVRKYVAKMITKFPAQDVVRTTAKPTTTTTRQTPTTAVPNEPVIDFIKGTDHTLGVWWWTKMPQMEDEYLNLLERNQVTEIYYMYGNTLNAESDRNKFHAFIQKAMAKGMRVFLLDGDPNWISADDLRVDKLITGCKAYKEQYPSDAFAGIHCDVEPKATATNLSDYVNNFLVKAQAFRQMGLLLEVDLGCGWWNQGKSVTYNGVTGFFNVVATMVDTMTMMSYRDYAEELIFVAKTAIDTANAAGTKIVLGIELNKSGEGDKVDFYDESRETAWRVLKEVDQRMAALNLTTSYGYAIHDMKGLYTLKIFD